MTRLPALILALILAGCAQHTTVVGPGTVVRLGADVPNMPLDAYDHTDANGVDVYKSIGMGTGHAGWFLVPPPTMKRAATKPTTGAVK